MNLVDVELRKSEYSIYIITRVAGHVKMYLLYIVSKLLEFNTVHSTRGADVWRFAKTVTKLLSIDRRSIFFLFPMKKQDN